MYIILQTIRQKIEDAVSNKKSFKQYFQEYVQKVQDECIELEIKTIRRNNILDSMMLDALVSDTYEGMREHNG